MAENNPDNLKRQGRPFGLKFKVFSLEFALKKISTDRAGAGV